MCGEVEDGLGLSHASSCSFPPFLSHVILIVILVTSH